MGWKDALVMLGVGLALSLCAEGLKGDSLDEPIEVNQLPASDIEGSTKGYKDTLSDVLKVRSTTLLCVFGWARGSCFILSLFLFFLFW